MTRKKIAEYVAYLDRQGYFPWVVADRRRVLRKFAEAGFSVKRLLGRLSPSVHTRRDALLTVKYFLRFMGRRKEAERIEVPRRPYVSPLRPPTQEDVRKFLASRDG